MSFSAEKSFFAPRMNSVRDNIPEFLIHALEISCSQSQMQEALSIKIAAIFRGLKMFRCNRLGHKAQEFEDDEMGYHPSVSLSLYEHQLSSTQ